MTIPIGQLLQKLGPDFDFTVFDRVATSKDFALLPLDAQKAIRDIQKAGHETGYLSRPAPIDRIREGAFPTPPTTPGPSGKSVGDQLWAVMGNLPLVGLMTQYDRAVADMKATGKPFMQAFGEEGQRINNVAMEWGHQISMGLIKSPEVSPEERQAFNLIVKPIAGITAMGMQGAGVFKALNAATKLPATAMLVEKLPQRLMDVGIGALTFGITDALRAEGVPEDPAMIDFSGRIAKELQANGVPDRLALLLGGSAVGSIPGAILEGFVRGRQFVETAAYARAATPAQLAEMRDLLMKAGIRVTPTESRWAVAQQYTKQLRKVVHNETTAGLVGEIQAREEWVAQQLYGSAEIARESEEARYLSALLRGQPGATSVARGVMNPKAAEEAAAKLGLKVDIKVIPTRPTTKEIIIGAAVKDVNGSVHVGTIHPEIYNRLGLTNEQLIALPEENRGFVTSSGRYVSREEALDIASKTNPSLADRANKRAEFNAKFLNQPQTPYLAADELRGQLKEPIEVPSITYDVIVSRPNYEYPSYSTSSRQAKRATTVIKQVAAETARDVLRKPTAELLLLADGEVVRGGLSIDQLTQKLRPQVPKVNGEARPDLAIRHTSQMVSIEVQEGNNLLITLPQKMTQEQFNNLAPAINTKTWNEVNIIGPKGAVTLKSPFGQQVQDAVTELVKPVKTTSKLTPELVAQYRRSGVFKGQAAVLADGTPVEVINKQGVVYKVLDKFTGQELKVHSSKMTVLPTTLEGEMAPGNFFMQHLDAGEQQAFAKLRLGLQQGLDQPIKKFGELSGFANSRGFVATQLKGGKIELARMTDGDVLEFADMQAAAQFVRQNTQPLPDLTPPEVKALLGGNVNFGFLGGSGKPPEFGEMVPIRSDQMIASLEANLGGRGPGAFAKAITPTRGLVLDMDRRFGTTFYPIFENIQGRYVGKQNFETLWYYGQGGKLPNGVMPLKKIQALAGPDANSEVITAILEGGRPTGATAQELSAAKELRKWYNALFTEYGIEADFVENYAPHLRDTMRKYGNPNNALIQAANDPLSAKRAGEFWADNIRHGLIDMYDTDAWRVAVRYLQQGSNNRFMKDAINQAAEVISRMGAQNQQLALPMAYFLQAVRGYEFWDQRVAIGESAQRILESLTGVSAGKEVTDLAEKMANYWMGAVYGSTMGARPGLAARNIATGLMMTWPLYGGRKSRFIEAMSMAMTEEGRNAAVADRAIALKQGPAMAATMQEPVLGSTFDKISHTAFAMYDGSDQYTRATAYWSARMKAQDALDEFYKLAKDASPERLATLRRNLIRDSGMHIQDEQVINEFFRRAASSPEGASRYAGKVASDVVNFLYGRGMQPRWMRGVGGRLLGQFGTWPLWYIDYLRRTTVNMARNGYSGEAAAFVAKHALVNAAVLYAGKQVFDVDLGRWTMYPSVFYSGGPGFQVATGLSMLARGLGSVTSGADDPLGPSRVKEGMRSIENVLPSMVPFYFGARDAVNFFQATDATQRLAALLSTKPTQEYDFQRRLDMVLGRPVQDVFTGNPYVDQWAEAQLQGQSTVPVEAIPALMQGLESKMSQPGTGPVPTPTPVLPPAGGLGGSGVGGQLGGTLPSAVPPGVQYRNPTEVRTSTEAKVPRQF